MHARQLGVLAIVWFQNSFEFSCILRSQGVPLNIVPSIYKNIFKNNHKVSRYTSFTYFKFLFFRTEKSNLSSPKCPSFILDHWLWERTRKGPFLPTLLSASHWMPLQWDSVLFHVEPLCYSNKQGSGFCGPALSQHTMPMLFMLATVLILGLNSKWCTLVHLIIAD